MEHDEIGQAIDHARRRISRSEARVLATFVIALVDTGDGNEAIEIQSPPDAKLARYLLAEGEAVYNELVSKARREHDMQQMLSDLKDQRVVSPPPGKLPRFRG